MELDASCKDRRGQSARGAAGLHRLPVGHSRRVLTGFAALLLGGASPAAAQKIDLSPSHWPAGELQLFDSLTRTRGRPIPLARGSTGMIAGTTGAAAVRAGLEALKQGGSAIDAVLTHALADIVLMVQTVVTHAGIMTLVYYDAATGKTVAMNAGWPRCGGGWAWPSSPVSTSGSNFWSRSWANTLPAG